MQSDYNIDAIESVESCLAAVGRGEGGYLWVGRDSYDSDDRAVFQWSVLSSDTSLIATGYDLRSGAGVGDDPMKIMSTFVHFLLACAESKSEESDNYTLFPREVREWAEMNSEELEVLVEDEEEEHDYVNRQQEDEYRAHSSSITGIQEGI